MESFIRSHKSLERRGGQRRGGGEAFACGDAGQDAAVFGDADDRRCQKMAVLVGNQAGFAVVELGNQAVGRAYVDTDLQGHECLVSEGFECVSDDLSHHPHRVV